MAETLFETATPIMRELEPARCFVRPISYTTARLVLADTHYIGTPGATSIALGLYIDGAIAGVITFGTVPRNNAAAVCGPDAAARVMELTRLALYDWAPPNSESWFIARSFEWLSAARPDVDILLSYADESAGHVGTIYQATNWIYTGASTNDVVFRCLSGEVLHPRTTGRMKGELPHGRWEPSPAKHRYVRFLGSRSNRRSLERLLRWSPLPYPKRQEATQ